MGASLDAERGVLIEGERPPPLRRVVSGVLGPRLAVVWLVALVAGIDAIFRGEPVLGLIVLGIAVSVAALWGFTVVALDRRRD